MPYQIEISASAQRDVTRLPGHIRQEARRRIRELAQDPRPPKSKELQGYSNLYRTWLDGKWRIIYRIDDEARMIRIVRVREKGPHTYEDLSAIE